VHTLNYSRVRSPVGADGMSQSKSQSNSQAEKFGTCSICGLVQKLIVSDGTMRKHGHSDRQPPCLGSWQLPRSSTTGTLSAQSLDPIPATPLVVTPGLSAVSGPSHSLDFVICQPSRTILSRIPKGARQRAAAELESRLRSVLDKPEDTPRWEILFEFATSLSQPVRGGKRVNLTNQILRQIEGKSVQARSRPSTSGLGVNGKKGTWSEEDRAIRRASFKLQEGDVRGAVRHLSSTETLAPFSDLTFSAMLAKHPPAPLDRRSPPAPSGPSLTVSAGNILAAIRGFSPGSAGGRDGLRPQHLKDMAEASGVSLCATLSEFANLVLAGGVPMQIRPSFFGATLLPFKKKDGGLRPIAVGLTLRRLIAKSAAISLAPICTPFLAPLQLGVGAKGGGEALVHAARTFLQSKSDGQAFVKLDFTNAFNTIRRDCVLEAVASVCPDLLPFALSSYGSPSNLWLGDRTLSSEEGVQQGDPLGPLLFCLTIQPLLTNCGCQIVTGYLDDLGVGDHVPHLIGRIQALEVQALSLGLVLNHHKCEVVGLAPADKVQWQASGLNFLETSPAEACFLGAPLGDEGVSASLAANGKLIEELKPKLLRLASHEAFFLLKSCFAVPRLQYLLRCTPAFDSPVLGNLSRTIRDSLSSILNIELEGDVWSQASLPVRWGGLGVRDIESLAASSYLSSLHASESLIKAILPPASDLITPPTSSCALESWRRWAAGATPPLGGDAARQRLWDDAVCRAIFDRLITHADRPSQARLLAVSSQDAGAWLHTLPLKNLGLCLGDREIRVAAGLRVGAAIVRTHTCVCGATVEPLGHHGLSCRRSAGRQRRHALANDVLVRAFRAADVQAELEPHLPHRAADDRKRPDGATLDPWSRGRPLAWDFTCPDTLAPSYVDLAAGGAGFVAARAEQGKIAKYASLISSNALTFAPVAIETLGAWGPSAIDLCRELGARLAFATHDPRAHFFLVQRLGLAVQRGNAASVASTFQQADMPI
jgi:hypothetical protein